MAFLGVAKATSRLSSDRRACKWKKGQAAGRARIAGVGSRSPPRGSEPGPGPSRSNSESVIIL